ncbi:ATP-dependent DNA ligase [Desulfosporosinus nitroreducens]|uniref:ATP-dependent DNA ligase n=1 Tax=Desulfosporosinus nitroreducens TaxID=2018668 RepID=UPI00207C3F7C|nr:RNA ligase family protein [Desulfosporosinus nitroreducens]MCO1604529.1 ATP-dependent DNA ligase [Desulfosporosinus nitroreducens]
MFISPMLLNKAEEPFDSDDWLSELKLDGIRFIYSTMDGTRFYTRHNNEVTNRFPELMAKDVPKGTILDGEIIMPDQEGKPDFEGLMVRFQTKNKQRIKILSFSSPVTYCVFDVLCFEGKMVTNLPLEERKELLNRLVPDGLPRITKTLSLQGKGKVLFESIKKKDLEGIVLKKKNSKYEVGKRSDSWLKVINYQYATVSIVGFRKSEFGWLLKFQDGRSAGIMELGVPSQSRKAVYGLAKMVKCKETNDYVYFPNDSLKCKVKYRALTKAGLLRLPSFVELFFV